MKQLLFTTDLSEKAEKALEYAILLAKKHKAKLTLLHFFGLPVSFTVSSEEDHSRIEDSLREEGCEQLKALYERTAPPGPGIPEPDYLCMEYTSLVKDILTVCKETKADLLITGNNGDHAGGIFTGNAVRQLLRQAPCPVLVVPDKSGRTELKKVAYASDLMEYDLDSIARLSHMIRPFHAELWILHVLKSSEEQGREKMEWFKELLKERVSYEKLHFQLLPGEQVYQSLIDHSRSMDFDLLVMLERENKSFFDHLFHEDLVIRAGMDGDFPLLSFNERSLRP